MIFRIAIKIKHLMCNRNGNILINNPKKMVTYTNDISLLIG